MTNKKEFYLITGINTTAEDFTKEGYKVISFGQVKKEIMTILKDERTALNYHNWNEFLNPENLEMKELNTQLQNIVFKESRGGRGRQVIGWENGESYLRYHSGVIYNWFK